MKAINNLRARAKASSKFEMTPLPGEGQQGQQGKQEGGEPPSQVQVEPKTYFANERTFIQWISAALLLLTVSSIMMGSGEYNGTSSVIAFAALVLVCYAALVYFRRVQLLRTGQAYGYLDFLGPSILAIGVGLGVAIVFADAVKGSEFLPWGKEGSGKYKDDDYNDRRLQAPEMFPAAVEAVETMWKKLSEVEGKCTRYAMDGINLLEYQPRDIILHDKTHALMVATPQALVTHPLLAAEATRSAVLTALSDLDIQSLTMVGDALFALSTGPTKTELIQFNAASMDISTTILIKGTSSTTGSLLFVPGQGKLYIHLDGNMHTYQLGKEASLSRTGSINMKVLNQGGSHDPISAMEHFEGLAYILRRTTIQVWDLESATLVSEMSLPTVAKNDKWVGMALERRNDDDDEEEEKSSFQGLRKSKMAAREGKTNTAVYLHMPLDTFPPQLWSFRLEEHEAEVNHDDHGMFSFPECDDGVAMN
jgi:uncharacterized membrane protein YidH (DUF202 family)